MLQGTFETLSLPEVLGLLTSARKSGALWLDAGPMSGVIHVEDGHCRAVETLERRDPVDVGSALLERLVELCFNVIRLDSGSFKFGADEPAPWRCPEPVELSDALVEVDRLLKQWREIVRVIPSLDCRPQLLDALVVDELIIDRDRWSLLVALDGRRTVRDIVERTGNPVLEVCHALLELAEAGAIGIIEPDAAPAPPPVERVREPEPAPAPPPTPAPAPPVERVPEPAPAPPVERVPEPAPPIEREPEPSRAPEPASVAERPKFQPPPAPAAPVEREQPAPDLPELEPEPEPVGAGATAGADRGAFLRMFSGLREK